MRHFHISHVTLACLIAANTVFATELPIATFDFAETEQARNTWVAAETTPPATVTRSRGIVDAGIVLRVPFETNPNLARSVLDKTVQLDLSSAGSFELDLVVDQPRSIRHVTLYFRSGNGWYACNRRLAKTTEEQSLVFAKSEYGTEGAPTGWHQIDGIRLAFWRASDQDAMIRLRGIVAVEHDVAVLLPESVTGSEGESARGYAKQMLAMLDELGIAADPLCDKSLSIGTLGRRRLVIVPYHPTMPPSVTAAIDQFVKRGGKVFFAYTMPSEIARTLGFEKGQYVGQTKPGDFAEIRLNEHVVPGLPASVKQASWNVVTAKPVSDDAKVVGWWFDANGENTGHPAVLISERGAYMTHVVLGDDYINKREMLAAIFGYLSRDLWREMAEKELHRSIRVGHCRSGQDLRDAISTSTDPLVKQAWSTALHAIPAARSNSLRSPREAREVAISVRKKLVDAYLRSRPSPDSEGRAVWNHTGTGAYPGDWERSCRELKSAGFNMILPNMLWAGRAHYASNVLPRSKTFEQHGDQIAQCLEAARKHRLEVHVWKVNYNLAGAPRTFVDELRKQGRLQVAADGTPLDWLNPAHPKNLQLEVDSLLEVVRKYDIDGLHFDYIRYPGGHTDFSPFSKQQFEQDTGREVVNWPADCRSGPLTEQYTQWRCDQVTKLVAVVSQEAKKIRPNVKISAAVFGAYPACRESVAQEWPKWVEAGYLDFICPMDYTNDDLQFRGLVANQMKLVKGRIPIYPGIGATASRCRLTADRVAGQIHHARELGASGFTVFDFHADTAANILPGLQLGVGATAAKPPHH
jgi:uncharacterized lipoprotein YddW (UPF0748 family)